MIATIASMTKSAAMEGLACIHLLAQAGGERTDFFRRWGESMRRYRGSGLTLLVVVLLLVVTYLGLRWLSRHAGTRRRRRGDDPMGVFRGLAALHRLERSEVYALEEVALENRLPDPGVLFARPSVFDRLFEGRLRAIEDDSLRLEAGVEVDRLRAKLFGMDAPTGEPSDLTAGD